MAPVADGLEVTVDERASGQSRTLRVASVVNCTGPHRERARGRLAPARDAVRGRHRSARIRSHSASTRCGDGALRDARGRESETLFALGPLRRGELWESTAVPEIRTQAQALALRLTREHALAAS